MRRDEETNGLIRRRQGLSEDELRAAEALKAICDEYEGLDLAVNLAEAGSDAAFETEQYLFYKAGDEAGDEAGALVGLLSADGWPDPEVYLMVHPAYRRQGIGTALLARATEDFRARGGTSCTLVAEEASVSGQAFVARKGAAYQFGEYRMELDLAAFRARRESGGPIRLSRATQSDAAVLVRVTAIALSRTDDEVRERFEREIESTTHRYYLGWLGDEPIGSIRVGAHGPRVFLTAFGVLPEHRGRGYGRQILCETIDKVLAENLGQVYIEVATHNRNALGLYRSCGFRETAGYLFYELLLDPATDR